MRISIPFFARKAIEVAATLGGRGLIVGGAVRDAILGLESKDFDVEIQGMSEETFRGAFATTLRTFGRVDEVGVSFGVLKFGHDVDISLPRRDSKTGSGHRDFAITVDTGMTITEALSRRDFTINAMAFDPLTGELIDPFGGRGDIEQGMLVATSAAFSEDPLRVMRGVQFAARFGFAFDAATAETCRTLLIEQKHLAKERVWGEWEKILTKGQNFEAFQRALHDTALDQILPSVFLARSGREETSAARMFAGRDLKPAAILASWGMSLEGTRVHGLFEALGVPLDLRRTARRLRDGARLASSVTWDETWARQIARVIAPVTLNQALGLATAISWDAMAIKWMLKSEAAAKSAGCFDGPIPAILDGHALIELGLTPGPEFGTILKAALEAQDRGEFTTRDEAMTMVQEGKFS